MTDIATTTARDRAERIRAKAADLLQEITEAFENRDHITLGYRTWGEYCRAEFDGRIALPRVKGDRVELCAALVDAGLSQRAVAEATGLSRNTVSKYVAPPAQIEPPLPTVLSRDEAERLTDELLRNDVELESATAELYQGRAWESLGYESWDDMVKAEWADLKLPMPLEDERQTVAPMAELVAQIEPPAKFTIPSTIEGVRELADTVAEGKGPDGMTVEQGRFALAATVTAWTQEGREVSVTEFERTNPKRAAKIKAEVEKIRAEYSDDEFALFGDLLGLELKHRAETERFLAGRRGEL